MYNIWDTHIKENIFYPSSNFFSKLHNTEQLLKHDWFYSVNSGIKAVLYWFGFYTARSIPTSKINNSNRPEKVAGWEYKLLKLRDNYYIYYKYIIFKFLYKKNFCLGQTIKREMTDIIRIYISVFIKWEIQLNKFLLSLAVVLYVGFENLVPKLVNVIVNGLLKLILTWLYLRGPNHNEFTVNYLLNSAHDLCYTFYQTHMH